MSAPSTALWPAHLRAAMLRFARLHLQPAEDAEDAVQEALVALLEASDRLASSADPRRYVFGVLKNKIVDRLRSKYRSAERHISQPETDELDAALFNARGHWIDEVAPVSWNTPEKHLASDQFFALVDACVNRLPDKVARVFSMKELLECEPPEVCETLGLSKSDYWQCMSRARKQLQMCLQAHGMGKGEAT